MKRLLYLTSTDWNWIKQRPQFIADCLSEYYQVTYVYPKTYRGKNIHKCNLRTDRNINLIKIFKFPYERFFLIKLLNTYLFRKQMESIIQSHEMIWITHPIIFYQLKSLLPGTKPVFYDCMDDHIEFPDVKKYPQKIFKILESEKELIDSATHIFFSADYLKNKVFTRYNVNKKCTVINNAIESGSSLRMSSYPTDNLPESKYKSYLKLVYTGTISGWFDFSIIKESLSRFGNIVYLLAGPREVNIPVNDRIIYLGLVRHEEINGLLSYSDALVMPFLNCELIQSVDPVKVYEYISVCKPAIILKYGETDKFKDFVYRYSTPAEYFELVGQLAKGNLKMKKSAEECNAFINANTWESRVKEIVFRLNDNCDKA